MSHSTQFINDLFKQQMVEALYPRKGKVDMPKTESYKSDLSDTGIDTKDVVILTVTRLSQPHEAKTIIVSEDELGDMMEQSDDLGSLILSD